MAKIHYRVKPDIFKYANPPKANGNVATGHVVSGKVVCVEKLFKTSLDGTVAQRHQGSLWMQHTEKAVWPGNRAKQKQQPGALKILH